MPPATPLLAALSSGEIPNDIDLQDVTEASVGNSALDTITLLRAGDTALAFSNIVIEVVGELAGVHAGLVLSERVGPAVQ